MEEMCIFGQKKISGLLWINRMYFHCGEQTCSMCVCACLCLLKPVSSYYCHPPPHLTLSFSQPKRFEVQCWVEKQHWFLFFARTFSFFFFTSFPSLRWLFNKTHPDIFMSESCEDVKHIDFWWSCCLGIKKMEKKNAIYLVSALFDQPVW